MNVVAILQARMGSERLPGKVLAPLCGEPMLAQAIGRIKRAKLVDAVCVATTNLLEDDPVQDYCDGHLRCSCFRGSAQDVLARYRECARQINADIIVRLTGDNPAVDPAIIDAALESFTEDCDYLSYRTGLPLGIGVEVFTREALERAFYEATDEECREHVTPYMYRNPEIFKASKAPLIGEDYSRYRLTVDTYDDLETMRAVFGHLGNNPCFGWNEAVALIEKDSSILKNSGIVQKEVRYKGEGLL